MENQLTPPNDGYEPESESFTAALRRAGGRIRSGRFPGSARRPQSADTNSYSFTPQKHEELWNAMAARISKGDGVHNGTRTDRPQYSGRFRGAFIGVAAAVGLVLTTSVSLQKGIFGPFLGTSAIKTVTYTTRTGQQANIQLDDGSSVVMNVGSSLSYTPAGRDRTRKVSLSGEAFFSVKGHSGSPFTVSTSNSVVTVLGTEFKVRDYSFEDAARIAVRSGRVNASGAVLDAGMSVVSRLEAPTSSSGGFSSGGSRFSVLKANQVSSDEFVFIDQKLAIDGLTLAEAIPLLEQWFDIDIQVPVGTVMGRRLTGVFPLSALPNLSLILEGSINVKVLEAGRTFVIIPAN